MDKLVFFDSFATQWLATWAALVVLLAVHGLSTRSRGLPFPKPRAIYRIVWWTWGASTLVLAATSLVPLLAGGAIHGWFLIGHTIGAGLFLGSLVLLVPLGFFIRFSRPAGVIHRLSFWGLSLSSIAATVPMLLSMEPLFGTDAMIELLTLHRYGGVATTLFATIHGYSVLRGR